MQILASFSRAGKSTLRNVAFWVLGYYTALNEVIDCMLPFIVYLVAVCKAYQQRNEELYRRNNNLSSYWFLPEDTVSSLPKGEKKKKIIIKIIIKYICIPVKEKTKTASCVLNFYTVAL